MGALGLRELGLLEEYRSSEHELGRDLFVPCLSVSNGYDRAVGYFTSSGLVVAARGLEAFVLHDGQMRLVASPALTDEDIAAIQLGLEARADVVNRALLRAIVEQMSDEVSGRLALLSLLVADDRLEIKIALARSPSRGLFHEKVAIFSDQTGDAVAIAGSANETQGGLIDNFEAVDVFTSWDSTGPRVARKQANFEALWENHTRGLEVFSFSEGLKRNLLERVPPINTPSRKVAPPPDNKQSGWEPREVLVAPKGFQLRDYQEEAIGAWQRNDGMGILSMATGSGKTAAAIAAAAALHDKNNSPLAIVIVAPFIHLVDQWATELQKWGVRVNRCYGTSTTWTGVVQQQCDLFNAGALDVLCLVATHATGGLRPFQEIIQRLDGSKTMFIADETHHLGSDQGLDVLPPHVRYRMGLSATPERWEDPLGTKALLDYFDGIVFRFDITDAISAGCLSHYEYLPELVDLDPRELEEYHQVTKLLVTELEKAPAKRNARKLQQLLIQRGEILDSAIGKLARLREAAEGGRPELTLIYCANRIQLSAVIDLLWERTVAARQFTGEETRDVRQEILDGFKNGSIPVIVAMKCLDEGVDVPHAREAYILASSGNPREFVQRRGRLLRKAPGKDIARIHDYVVLPDPTNDKERDFLSREIRRVVEFAQSADNRSSALDVIWPTLERLRLLHEVGR